MDVSSVKKYAFNIGIGAGCGALFSVLVKDFQVWRSPNGGKIACLFAERVAANTRHIKMGFTLAVNATVPMDYTLLGKIVPTICSFNTLLIGSIGLGILIGVCYTATCYTATRQRQKAN